MALVVESFCVVLRCEALETRWPGGLQGFEQQRPNETFCSDGSLCRVAFMSGDDARAWVARLADHGIAPPGADGSPDVAVCDDRRGIWQPCDWLEAGPLPLEHDGGTVEVSAVWMRGVPPGPVATPSGFAPGRVSWVDHEELQRDWEQVPGPEGVDTWRHRETGALRYVGRPAVADGQRLDEALEALKRTVWELAEPHDGPLTAAQMLQLQAAEARAVELEAAMIGDPNPVLLRGVVARRLGRWPDAEAAFRRLTELQPEFEGGWLDLTWALGEQQRHTEAAVAARRAVELVPESAAALSNLAATLMFLEEYAEAREMVARALAIDPTDDISLHLRAELDRRAPEPAPPTTAPWWKRLLGLG